MASKPEGKQKKPFCRYVAEVDHLIDSLMAVDGETCCPVRLQWKVAGIECNHRAQYDRGAPPATVAFEFSCILMKLGFEERTPWLRAILVGQCLAAMSIFSDRHLDEIDSLSPAVRQLYRVVRYASDSAPEPAKAREMLKWVLNHLGPGPHERENCDMASEWVDALLLMPSIVDAANIDACRGKMDVASNAKGPAQ